MKRHTTLETDIKMMAVCLHSDTLMIVFTMCYVHVWSSGQESKRGEKIKDGRWEVETKKKLSDEE